MFKSRSTISHSILVFLCMLVCGGCLITPKEPPTPTIVPGMIDESWLTGEPCSLPCWYGLQPGVSTKEDAIKIAKDIPLLSSYPPSESQLESWDEKTMIYFMQDVQNYKCKKDPPGGICVVMYFRNNLLRTMHFYQTYRLTFEEVVDRLGDPDGYTTFKLTPEAQGCDVSLYWKKQHLAITYTEAWFNWYSEPFRSDMCEKVRNEGNKIPRDLKVGAVEIMDDYTWDFYTNGIHPWKGFVGDK